MDWLDPILAMLALPRFGLTTLFIASFISATLLPVASEPALYGLLRLNPELFWSATIVATAHAHAAWVKNGDGDNGERIALPEGAKVEI